MTDRVTLNRESERLTAKAFEEYSMRRTPSAFLVDKYGLLKHIDIDFHGFLNAAIKYLLHE